MLGEEDAVVEDIDADVRIDGRPNDAGGGEPRRSCRVEKSRICTDDSAAGSPVLLATTLPPL